MHTTYCRLLNSKAVTERAQRMKIRDDGRVAPVRHEGIRRSGGIAPLTLREEKTPISMNRKLCGLQSQCRR